MAEDALKELEIDLGLVSPETSLVSDTEKELGPAAEEAPETEKTSN